MTTDEIKLRQLAGQHLLSSAAPLTAAGDLCGIQAQFLSNALHALTIRCGAAPDTEALVKSWTIRGTMHLFPQRDLPLFLHQGRSHFLRPRDTLAEDECISAARKETFAALIVDSVSQGVEDREALKAVCFQAGMTGREAESVFDPWGGTLRALCEAGILCHKVQEKKAFRLCPPFEPMEEQAARLELARRYFTHYGPATIKDAAYFFGATQARVKSWLARLPVASAECGGRTYFYTGRNLPSGSIPGCLFLAGFDPLMLGYQKTESLWLAPEHLRGIFSLAGIVSPALLLRGRVAGRWKRKGNRLAVTLFEPLSSRDLDLIRDTADALWNGVNCSFEA